MAQLRACEHQVGGHMTKDSTPDTLVDGAGSFYKPYQAGDRNVREAAFYGLLWGNAAAGPTADPVAAPSSAPPPVPTEAPVVGLLEVATWGEGPAFLGKVGTAKQEDTDGLREFIPRSYGVAVVDGRQYLVMEDVCAQYKKPCVLDLKMGFSTVYEWADDKYKDKCRPKDIATTQGSVGFRLSGLQVYKRGEGVMDKSERQWGKTLSAETMPHALIKFAGDHDPVSFYQDTTSGVMSQLLPIQKWFQTQTSYCFFQASLLITYEGEATAVADANVQIHLIDFAHTFPTNGEPDTNVSTAIDSLINMIKALGP